MHSMYSKIYMYVSLYVSYLTHFIIRKWLFSFKNPLTLILRPHISLCLLTSLSNLKYSFEFLKYVIVICFDIVYRNKYYKLRKKAKQRKCEYIVMFIKNLSCSKEVIFKNFIINS